MGGLGQALNRASHSFCQSLPWAQPKGDLYGRDTSCPPSRRSRRHARPTRPPCPLSSRARRVPRSGTRRAEGSLGALFARGRSGSNLQPKRRIPLTPSRGGAILICKARQEWCGSSTVLHSRAPTVPVIPALVLVTAHYKELISPLESAVTSWLSPKSFRFCTYINPGGGGPAKASRLLHSVLSVIGGSQRCGSQPRVDFCARVASNRCPTFGKEGQP